MPSNLIFGLPNRTSVFIALSIVGLVLIVYALTVASRSSLVHPRLRAAAASGWLPVLVLAGFATVLLAAYGTSIRDTAFFAAYITLGIAIPGMLWVRLLRDRSTHVSEDLAMGLAAGYCVEIATYVAARAVGAPLLFVLWPVLTIVAFAAAPALRKHWHGSGTPAPIWWSWSLASILGYLLIYSAGTFFASHHLTGTDTPYPDMPYHLALIGELINHVPPQVPFVSGMPLAYHWFFYADAAATSWATGISPLTLLYRLSMLPMFVGFVALTAATAQRFTGRMSSGPIAVAIALFGVAAAPYRWVGTPVFNSQTLDVTWISPTNLFGLAIFAAVLLTVVDLLRADASVRRRYWLLLGLLVAGAAGAKASLLPLLIVGLLAVIAGFVVGRRRIHRHAMVALLVAGIGFLLATIFIYLGSTRGLVIGLDSLRSFPVVGVTGAGQASGISSLVLPSASFLVAIVLWSFMWAGASGLLVRRQGQQADPGILLLLGVCAAGLGAATVFSYPGLSQAYYLTAAAGAFGVIVTAGVSRLVPSRAQYLRLIICVAAAAVLGAAVVLVIRKLGPAAAPSLSSESLLRILVLVVLPVLAMAIVAATAFIVLRLLAPRMAVLEGAVPLLVVALVMGFSLPNVATVVASPFTGPPMYSITVPSAGIDTARWIRDHTAIDDLVATNLHCDSPTTDYSSCNPTSFWVSAYSQRHVLVEGWAYTTKSVTLGPGVVAPFWDQELLAANDSAFTDPSAAAEARLRDKYGVRWLLADLTGANSDSIGRFAKLRFREGAFAVYELTGS